MNIAVPMAHPRITVRIIVIFFIFDTLRLKVGKFCLKYFLIFINAES